MIWTTKEAVRLGLPGVAKGEACDGCPPLERLFQQFEEWGGELWLCRSASTRGGWTTRESPIAKIVGATPMWQWAGDDTTVFSY